LGTSYIIIGTEVCPKTGRLHHQGYCEFSSNKKFNTLCKFDPSFHWERRAGTQQEAIDYCMKDKQFVEFGEAVELVGRGKRTDIKLVKELVANGAGMGEIYDVCTSFQSLRFVGAGLKYKVMKRSWVLKVYWYWELQKLVTEEANVYRDEPYKFWMFGKILNVLKVMMYIKYNL